MNENDWEGSGPSVDYRAGMSLRKIAQKYGVTHPTVKLRQQKEGWVRDLGEKIRTLAQAKLQRQIAQMNSSPQEREVIEANADVQVALAIVHRTALRKARGICERFVAELQDMSEAGPSVQETIHALLEVLEEKEADRDLTQVLMQAAKSFQSAAVLRNRTQVLESLVGSLKQLIAAEREAFGMNKEGAMGTTIEDLLKAYADGGGG